MLPFYFVFLTIWHVLLDIVSEVRVKSLYFFLSSARIYLQTDRFLVKFCYLFNILFRFLREKNQSFFLDFLFSTPKRKMTALFSAITRKTLFFLKFSLHRNKFAPFR